MIKEILELRAKYIVKHGRKPNYLILDKSTHYFLRLEVDKHALEVASGYKNIFSHDEYIHEMKILTANNDDDKDLCLVGYMEELEIQCKKHE